MAVQAKSVNLITTAIGITIRLIVLQLQFIPFAWFVIKLHTRDAIYTALALLFPYRQTGHVIQRGDPGYGGLWPQYAPPQEGDARSPCPGINVLANHGIIPRNGRRITYKQLSEACQKAFNLSPTLSDRHDIAFVQDQSVPDPGLVNRFADHATITKNGRRYFALGDIAYYNGLRRAECKASNGEYSMTYSFFHKFFGSGNCAMLYAIFGADAEDLRTFLLEERFAPGWEPKTRWHSGQTILFAQITTLMIEFNTWEGQKLRPGDTYFNQQTLKKKAY
ncbi:hypothetical protein FRB90_001416 [Tulasnella sp. 427]|nr:hypothetical protein FRB90_001416 [Tulasnella sp. 427]